MMFARLWQCGALFGVLAAGTQGALPAPAAVAEAAREPSGRELVTAAGAAIGPRPARARANSLWADHMGTYFAVEQARAPAEPITQAARVFRWRFDAAAGRVIREAEQHFPGGVRFWTRTALAPAGGWSVDVVRWRTGTDLQTVSADEGLRARLQWERYLPHLLIRQAEAASTVEALGPDSFRYKDAAGDTVEVALDPRTRLATGIKQTGPGAATGELIYSEYRRRHGVMLPHRLQIKQGERIVEDLRLGKSGLARLRDADFEVPAGYTPPPAAGEPRAREFAPGVLYFENMPGNYHSLAVDLGDRIILLEAPLSPESAAIQRRLIEQARPGKQVSHVLVTHHHGDHNGGLLPWAEAGAVIVVPAGARVAIERQLRARNYKGELRIEEVDGRRSFGSGPNRVDAHAFSSSHAAAHMVMHLPDRRILFQGDLFSLPERGGPPPAFPIVRELQAVIARLGLEFDWIVGVHGRPGTPADLAESLRQAARPG